MDRKTRFQILPTALPLFPIFSFLSSPSLDAFTKVSAAQRYSKIRGTYPARRVRQLRRHGELSTSALLHDGSLPMTRELLGSPVFNPLPPTRIILYPAVCFQLSEEFVWNLSIPVQWSIVVHSYCWSLKTWKEREKEREKKDIPRHCPINNI